MPRLTVNSNANDIQYKPKSNCPKLYEHPIRKTLKIVRLLL